jgi:aspartate racemase
MIDATLDEIRRRDWQRVGVLGFGEPAVHTGPLAQLGVTCETISGDLRARLDGAIGALMEGHEDEGSVCAAQEAVDELRARRVDGIILGCTEIPLLLGDTANAPDLVDPLELLVDAAVNHALNVTTPA